jgi:hypothetical protein
MEKDYAKWSNDRAVSIYDGNILSETMESVKIAVTAVGINDGA